MAMRNDNRKSLEFSAQVVLSEAEIAVQHGRCVADPILTDRLEAISQDVSLPTSMRARALSLLCKLG